MTAATAAAVTTRWWSLPLWAGISAVTLFPMPYAGIMPSPLILADPRTLAAYGVFFLYGWLLYRGRDHLECLTRWWSWKLLLTIAGLIIAWRLAVLYSPIRVIGFVIDCLMSAFFTWAMVMAAFGLFLHYARAENRIVRFLSDASYWSYIVHLPVVVFVAGALAPWPLRAEVKFAIVLLVTSALCLWTYHAFVRTTIVGELLNGRRAARSPQLART